MVGNWRCVSLGDPNLRPRTSAIGQFSAAPNVPPSPRRPTARHSFHHHSSSFTAAPANSAFPHVLPYHRPSPSNYALQARAQAPAQADSALASVQALPQHPPSPSPSHPPSPPPSQAAPHPLPQTPQPHGKALSQPASEEHKEHIPSSATPQQQEVATQTTVPPSPVDLGLAHVAISFSHPLDTGMPPTPSVYQELVQGASLTNHKGPITSPHHVDQSALAHHANLSTAAECEDNPTPAHCEGSQMPEHDVRPQTTAHHLGPHRARSYVGPSTGAHCVHPSDPSRYMDPSTAMQKEVKMENRPHPTLSVGPKSNPCMHETQIEPIGTSHNRLSPTICKAATTGSHHIPQAVAAKNGVAEQVKRLSMMTLRPIHLISTLRRASSDTCLARHDETKTQAMKLPPIHPHTPFLSLPRQRTGALSYNMSASFHFAQRTVDAVNDGATCILIALGHRLKLFTVLSRMSPAPQPANVIASTAGLRTRPVEEWLNAMACAGILELRAEDDLITGTTSTSYNLPVEHAIWLTWGGGTNLALLCQTVPALGRVEHAVVTSYKHGIGVDRSAYVEYETVQAYDVMQTVGVRVLSVLNLVPGLVDTLSRGATIFCVGGAADAVFIRLARMFPRTWFTCYGTDSRRVSAARKMTEDVGVTNVHFKTVLRLEQVYERNSYDAALVFEGSAIRESDDPIQCLVAMRLALYPGRPLLYVEMMAAGDVLTDSTHRVATYLYSVAALYNLPKAIAQGSSGKAAGGIWGHVSVRKALYEAKFADVYTHALEDDSLNCVLVAITHV